MKFFLTLALILTGALSIHAQSFVFMKEGMELSNNAAFEVSEVSESFGLVIESDLKLVNLTSKSVNIVVRQTVLVPPASPAAVLGFCFEVCKTTNENASIEGALLPKGDPFHAYLALDEGYYESVVVKYEAYKVDNPSEKIAVTVTYKYDNETAIKTIENDHALKIYPKGNQIIFEPPFISDGNVQAAVYDIAGRIQATQSISGNRPAVLATNLQKGIYLVTLTNQQGIIGAQKISIQ
jgi:hypothetical protein